MCSTSRRVPVRRLAGMAAARLMLLDRAVKPAVAPAICRNRRRLSSDMDPGTSSLSEERVTRVLPGQRVRETARCRGCDGGRYAVRTPQAVTAWRAERPSGRGRFAAVRYRPIAPGTDVWPQDGVQLAVAGER